MIDLTTLRDLITNALVANAKGNPSDVNDLLAEADELLVKMIGNKTAPCDEHGITEMEF